jgi:integrase
VKLPNGYGSVHQISSSRRKPWRARVTMGWTEDNKQIYYTIGYYKSRMEALAALLEYNQNPIGQTRDITLEQLYTKWSKTKYKNGDLSISTINNYKAAWKRLAVIGDMPVRDIRKSHLQDVIFNMIEQNMSQSSCAKVKALAGILLKEAIGDSITKTNYAELIDISGSKTPDKKEIFTDFEIKAIEELAKTDIWANTILILIYTGMRIGELISLTKFNVDLDKMIITGGIKTDAGKNRMVPIHNKIKTYIEGWYKQPGSYLIQRNGEKIRTDYYRKYLYYPALEKAQVRKLTPHSTRHTFASLISRAGANTKAIQDIIGHTDYATTANIYTHLDAETLREAINLIK